jgi:hypothetical protein
MTFDEAKAAIEQAGQADAAAEASQAEAFQQQAAPTPAPDQAAEPTPPVEAQPDEQPETDTQFTGGDEDSFMGEGFNPDLLPAELQPGFKQLQGRWTQRMQEVAEQRKELEALGDVESLKQAAEFYASLQDPEYLRAFYGELGSIVGELDGGVPEEPAAEPAEPVVPEIPADLVPLVESDPELKPFAEQMAAMRAELDGFRAEQAAEREALQEEAAMMAQAHEISQQVDAVRAQHPEYSEDDWEAIYDLADARDGNVLVAADIFQQINDRAIKSWTDRKEAPQAVRPQPGAATVSEDAEQQGPTTLKEADAAAQSFLDANDLAEFTG